MEIGQTVSQAKLKMHIAELGSFSIHVIILQNNSIISFSITQYDFFGSMPYIAKRLLSLILLKFHFLYF